MVDVIIKQLNNFHGFNQSDQMVHSNIYNILFYSYNISYLSVNLISIHRFFHEEGGNTTIHIMLTVNINMSTKQFSASFVSDAVSIWNNLPVPNIHIFVIILMQSESQPTWKSIPSSHMSTNLWSYSAADIVLVIKWIMIHV